jgi:hypothetical protein
MNVIHVSSFFTPMEYCAVYGVMLAHSKAGRIAPQDAPETQYEELLWGARYLWDKGLEFDAIDFDDDGSILFVQTEPVPGSFPAPVYHAQKGLLWIIRTAREYLQEKASWLEEDIDMLRALEESVERQKRKIIEQQRTVTLN